jgi:hypothetical protein
VVGFFWRTNTGAGFNRVYQGNQSKEGGSLSGSMVGSFDGSNINRFTGWQKDTAGINRQTNKITPSK